MFGSFAGNAAGISYFLAFQILGILLSLILFRKEKAGFTLLMGSVAGSLFMQWLPVLYAFLFDFTIQAHIFALLTMLFGVILAYTLTYKSWKEKAAPEPFLSIRDKTGTTSIAALFREDPVLFLLIPLFLFMVITLNHHTISYMDGAMHSGQSTYGDMNMHLGFITSIAKQQTFPPEYSILPGTRLAYPFLSDSISSSIYLFGSSLRVAYLLPMYIALLQVFFGMYCTAKCFFRSLEKPCRGKSFLAFVFFFFNGGLGFYYFTTKGFHNENFTRIFSAFYETPTNYVSSNIQWHNILCDMLIPQRATLFGWAILFPVLALLMKARSVTNPSISQLEQRKYFILAGTAAGGLVLIHTHSFLALGILCAGFLTLDLYHARHREEPKRWPLIARFGAVMVCITGMSLLRMKQLSDAPFDASVILALGIAILCCFAVILVYHLIREGCSQHTLMTWGFFLAIVLILAIPQLFGFTFRQAQGEQFVRGSFNWANSTDGYLWFYIKNLGVLFLIAILLLFLGTRRQIQLVLPACLLWLLSEFILFQPNAYDNNKLLLVAYLFFCIAAADFVWDTIPTMIADNVRQMRGITVAVVTALATFAAILTMGREYVSDYELYDASYVALAEWVDTNTQPDDTFLTATNHNNAIASLTGRSIVCGAGTFLYYHGVDYGQNEADVKTMYEDASQRDALLRKHNVDYIVIGAWELGSYSISDYEEMLSSYDVVYNKDGVVVLAV